MISFFPLGCILRLEGDGLYRGTDETAHGGNVVPFAFACSMILPIAVPSLGPAMTGTPTALQVNWLSRLLREPPPIMCNFSIGNGAIFCSTLNICL